MIPGADPTGATSSADALQAALNASGIVDWHGPNGAGARYMTDRTLHVNADQGWNLTGAGWAGIQLVAAPGFMGPVLDDGAGQWRLMMDGRLTVSRGPAWGQGCGGDLVVFRSLYLSRLDILAVNGGIRIDGQNPTQGANALDLQLSAYHADGDGVTLDGVLNFRLHGAGSSAERCTGWNLNIIRNTHLQYGAGRVEGYRIEEGANNGHGVQLTDPWVVMDEGCLFIDSHVFLADDVPQANVRGQFSKGPGLMQCGIQGGIAPAAATPAPRRKFLGIF